ncbi:peptidyl-prolyl cis-trans isomerase D [Dysgonomonas sp. PFB1-18]|uniref:peptidylprolyl isomerase n=1 Tax=unclassified Dysgonomonas TaxID=2630389 RepID=UPI0024733AE8|nr:MULTISPECIES: peptidylprolyl isomerase [unclassified Dysgonomonas]MDH6310500.1 peptidyl-prolyl cis-trans isomerase D [Dysgonomonas sp. PF1-14]MDH6340350.1 peptidyl-prolyl cis-trans isomerase D [Dysgonomonas sp. PF1-16]MDH6382070.1 peptidyl-prolyl cis-trans isomerase D [Dysgonomonas sp. PFB1-18]MDH6399321.1 peptidyl-prolyl cis-trans isomerase D [Dysgonomonas sp. PF1-23]
MAALQKIRAKSGLLVGIIAVGLLAFVFPWGEVTTFVNKMRDKAFVVDGDVVTTGQYANRIAEWENFQKIMSGQSSLDELATAQIREMVYQQMVKEAMLDNEAKKLGLEVTKEELSDMVYGTPASIFYQIPFFTNPQTGQFDKAYLMQFLSDINQDPSTLAPEQAAEVTARRELWAFIQNMMKYQRLEEKYASLVAGTVLVNDTEAKAMHNDSKNVANIAYVVQRYSSLPDSIVDVSEKDIKALYDQRKGNFKLDTELRKISYFIKDVIPSDEDYAVVEKEMSAVHEKLMTAENPALLVSEYSSNPYIDAFMAVSTLPTEAKTFVQSASVGEIYGPVRDGQSYIMYKLVGRTNAADSVKLQIIPMPQGIDAATSAHLSDSILTVIKGGKDFTTVANEVMPGSNGGELGWVNEVMIAGAGIAKECFAAAKGEILKLTINGQTQLVRVQDKTNPVAKVKLAIIQMPVIISDRTQNAIDNELNQFVSESGNLENFDKAAQAKGYALVSNTLIAPSEMGLGQTSGTRQVIHWAFNNKVGTVNKFDTSDKRVIAIVKSEVKGDYLPVSEVSAALKTELINEKKAVKMIDDLKAKSLTSLGAYAEAVSGRVDSVNFVTFQTNNISGIGLEPVMNVYAKAGQIGKLTSPLKGKAGVYVLDVASRNEDTKELNIEQTKQSLKQNNFYQLMSQAVAVLKDKVKVEDNRVKFW